MSNYGTSLYCIGQIDSSLYYTTEAFKLKVEVGFSSKQIEKTLVNIGIAYMIGNKNEESIDYFLDVNLEEFVRGMA